MYLKLQLTWHQLMSVGSHLSPGPHLLQPAAVASQGEGGGVDMEPVLPDIEDGQLAGLALNTAAGINSLPKPSI